jgi:hypothetical protein
VLDELQKLIRDRGERNFGDRKILLFYHLEQEIKRAFEFFDLKINGHLLALLSPNRFGAGLFLRRPLFSRRLPPRLRLEFYPALFAKGTGKRFLDPMQIAAL